MRLWTSRRVALGDVGSGGAGGEDAGGGDEVGDAFDLVAPEADGRVVEARYSTFFAEDYVGEAGDVGDGWGVGFGGGFAIGVRCGAGSAQPVTLLMLLEPEVLVEDAE